MGKQLVNLITCGCESSAPFVIYKVGASHSVLMIGLCDLLGNPTLVPNSLNHPGPLYNIAWGDYCVVLLNVTFNNNSAISWRLGLLMEETTDLPQVTDKLYHIMLNTLPWSRFELTTSVVISTDFIGSCKSNYHTITSMTTPSIS
jgi:hypothetical protein